MVSGNKIGLIRDGYHACEAQRKLELALLHEKYMAKQTEFTEFTQKYIDLLACELTKYIDEDESLTMPIAGTTEYKFWLGHDGEWVICSPNPDMDKSVSTIGYRSISTADLLRNVDAQFLITQLEKKLDQFMLAFKSVRESVPE